MFLDLTLLFPLLFLNHTNLFGGSYARQPEGMMERLLREVA